MGRRVNEAEKAAIKCGTEKDGRIKALEDDTERQETAIGEIYEKVNTVQNEVAALPGKIDSAVGGMAGKLLKSLSIALTIVVVVVQAVAFVLDKFVALGAK